MATVEQQIAVRIKNFVEGLPQVQALSAAVQGLARVNGSSGLKATSAQVVNLGNVSDKTLKNVSSLYTGFQNVSKGFANGSTSVRNFTGDLGVAAREMKAITDQSRLLNPASSIQLPVRNPVFETLKPLVEGEAVIKSSVRSLATEAETTNRIVTNAERLAEAWQQGNAAVKKQVEQLAALNAETNAAFKNIISGNKSGASTGASTSGVNVKPVQELNEAVDKVPGKIEKASSAVSGFFRSLGRIVIISALFAAFYEIVNTIKGAISAVEEAVKSFISEGVRYNASLETSKVSLASLIAQTSDIKDSQGNLVTGAEKFAAAEQIAGEEMSKVQAIALSTRFQFEDILQAVTLATAALGGTNVTISQTLGLVEKLGRAAGAVRLNPQQFQTQVRQILTGATRVQTTLAVALFPGQAATQINKQIKDWREAGTLVDNLNKRLEVFSFTAKEVEGTFDALASNVQDAFSVFAGKATLPLFEDIKKALDFILKQIVVFDDEGVRLTPTFQKLADILSIIGGTIGTRILSFVKTAADAFDKWVATIKNAPGSFEEIGNNIADIAHTLVGMIGDFLQLIYLMLSFGDATTSTNIQLQTVSSLLAVVRDLLKVVYGIIETIVAAVKSVVVLGVLPIATAILTIEGRLDKVTDAARTAVNAIKDLFAPGLRNFFGGLSGEDAPGSRAASARGEAGLTASFNAFPRKATGDQTAASDRAKRERINVLKQLNEAATALFLAQAKNEIDIQNNTNDEIIKAWQRRYDQGLVSAKEFYAEKEKLTLENIQREENYQNQQLEAEKEKLRLNLAALEGQADISDAHFQELLNKFNNAGDRSQINPKDTLFNKQITEFLKFQKEGTSIQAELNKLTEQRKSLQTETNNETADSVRLNRQLSEELKGQLADALGAAGESDQINLSKRISDELPKLLSEFGAGIPGLQEVSNLVHDLADASLDDVLKAFDTFNIDVDKLPEPLKTVLDLFKQLQVASQLTQSSGRAKSLTESLRFDLEGIATGFDKGEIGLTDAVSQSQERKRTAIDGLNAELQKQKDILDTIPQPKTAEELAHYNAVTQAVAGLGREIEALKNGTDELSLVTSASQRSQDIYAAKIDQIAIKRRDYSITANEATKEETAAQKDLLQALEDQLAAAERLNQTVPENAKEVAELINKIGVLQNETHAETLDLAHGIEDSIGGAFNNFYDTIAQGNQGMLASFKQAIAGMLAEIAKLIFQTYVLKQVMSFIQSGLGSLFGGGGGGVTGGVAGDHAAGFAEGGIVSGPGTSVSDSVHAMLSPGEAVIPAKSVSTYGRGLIQSLISGSFIPMRGFARFAEGGFAGGAGGGRGSAGSGGATRIVNVLDQSVFHDWLNSSSGEKVILNVIGRNRSTVQGLVG